MYFPFSFTLLTFFPIFSLIFLRIPCHFLSSFGVAMSVFVVVALLFQHAKLAKGRGNAEARSGYACFSCPLSDPCWFINRCLHLSTSLRLSLLMAPSCLSVKSPRGGIVLLPPCHRLEFPSMRGPFSFCPFQYLIFSFVLLEDSLAEHGILINKFFSFSSVQTMFYCLLSSFVAVKKLLHGMPTSHTECQFESQRLYF